MPEADGQTLVLLDPATECPVCGAQRPQPLHAYPNPKRRIAAAEQLILTGCRACGMAWSHPLPSAAEVDAWYAGTGGWERRPGLRAQAAGGEDAEAKLSRKLEAKRPARERETELLLPLLGTLPAHPSVLDFGCGIGAWLDAFAARGWATTGIEPGPTARAITSRRHRMLDTPPETPEFDLVLVQHVVEHLRDPLAAVRALAAAVRPGGAVFVSVPSFDRLPAHGKLGYVASGVHLFSYTAEGLARLLARAGLDVVAQPEGGGWEEGSQGPAVHLKLLARKADPSPATRAGDPLAPARAALREWGRRRRAELEAAPAPAPPRGLARLRRDRRAAHRAVATKRERRLLETDLALLDLPEACPCCAAPESVPLCVRRHPDDARAHLVVAGCRRCGAAFAHPPPASDGAGTADMHDAATRDGRRVLHVGPAGAAWLDVVAQAGWEAGTLGADARRLDAIPADRRYDLIVLERPRDPLAALRSLRAAARPRSSLLVSFPVLGEVVSGRQPLAFTTIALRTVLGLSGWHAEAPVDGQGPGEPWMRALAGDPVDPPEDLDPLAATTDALGRGAAQGAGSSSTSSFSPRLRAFSSDSSSR